MQSACLFSFLPCNMHMSKHSSVALQYTVMHSSAQLCTTLWLATDPSSTLKSTWCL